MMERKLDYSEISAEEISDPAKYSSEEWGAWYRHHKMPARETRCEKINSDDLFMQGFNQDYDKKVRSAMGLPKNRR
jgi:hypothetical protein